MTCQCWRTKQQNNGQVNLIHDRLISKVHWRFISARSEPCFTFSLRLPCVLCVSAVDVSIGDFNLRDAENTEEAQSFYSLFCISRVLSSQYIARTGHTCR